MTEWLWVIIKVCRATRSLFALTLLSFTPLLATALTSLAIETYFEGWIGLICKGFVASVPIQSWLFAMQYLKSYLFTCAGGDSVIYKIHTLIKYTVIVAYSAVMIYFKWRSQPSWQQY